MREWKTLEELKDFKDFKVIRTIKEKYFQYDGILKRGFDEREQEVYPLVYADGLTWKRCDSVYYAYSPKSLV